MAHGQCGVETKIEMLQNSQTQFLKKKEKKKGNFKANYSAFSNAP